MERILTLFIAAILFTSCAVSPEQPGVQGTDGAERSTETSAQLTTEPEIVFLDELLNEPPENPRFVVARPSGIDSAEQGINESIKRQLLRLGYVEAESRDDANVVVWYGYDSEQTGLRQVGKATDVWGEQLVSVVVSDLNSVKPVSFKVQIISLQESRFPGQVIPVWQGEWSSSVADMNMLEFSGETLAQVFDLYQSEQTQSQIAAFRQARERNLQRAINTYMAMVMYRIQKNWQKPKKNVKGKQCKVKILQSAVGEIKSHQVLTCDKDRRFKKSIEKAIKASSPLPLPKQDLFDRSELILIFQG